MTDKDKALKQALELIERLCFCHSGVSLQSVSGGAAPEGYLGKVTLLIDGELVDYVKAQPPLPVQPERPWVGLTGLEQKAIMAMNSRNAVFETEAKLKEKNHG